MPPSVAPLPTTHPTSNHSEQPAVLANLKASDMPGLENLLRSDIGKKQLARAAAEYLVPMTKAEWQDLDDVYFTGRRVGRAAFGAHFQPKMIADFIGAIAAFSSDPIAFENDITKTFNVGMHDGYNNAFTEAHTAEE